ncbi:MAG: S9 family peptidase [bacterium]|nr:S9 family peptidase [bacterium]
MKSPTAEKIAHTEERHGRRFEDPYAWMRDRSTPEADERVLNHLRAENAYADEVMQSSASLRRTVYDEMVERIKEDDSSVPRPHDNYFYYWRTEKGKQYPFYCRKTGSLEAPEELLLDANALAEGHGYFRLGAYEISPDHKLLAYAVDLKGDESYTIHFKNLETGDLHEDRIDGAYVSVVWANDNRTVFYSTLDSAHRPYRLQRHTLGGAAGEDALIYEEKDDAFFLGAERTRSGRYLVLHLESNTTSEVHVLDADRPLDAFRVVEPRRHRIEYTVEHWNDRFFILTNEDAVNFKLVEAPVDDPGRANWTEVIAHRPSVRLQQVEAFAGHVTVVERVEGLLQLRIISLPDRAEHHVSFDEPAYEAGPAGNLEYETTTLRFVYSSLTSPESVFDYDMDRRTRELRKVQEVLGGYDKENYASERIFATASDGTRVPISLVYRRDLVRDGSRPLLLYGYGSYGATIDPGFGSTRVSLLDRGVIYAIAHVRGGGDMGRPWYEDGKLLHKRNTFTDFIACAEHLIGEGYTSSGHLAIMGGSAGGLLIGATVNLRPQLFRAAVAKVPFVDVINTLSDASLPLTVIEWEEWGNPEDASYFDYILSYSPYDNIGALDYPEILVTAGLNDPRVAYWEPAKWVARLRERKSGPSPVMLKTNLEAGHAGASGRYNYLEELAFDYAFVLSRLGAEQPT